MSDTTFSTRRFMLLVGVGTVVVGVLSLLVPNVAVRFAGGIPILNAIGLIALVVAVRTVSTRLDTPVVTTTLPDVRARQTGTLAGHAVEAALQDGRAVARTMIKSSLETVLARDFEPDAVSAQLADGSWTDNATAAAFLSRSRAADDGLFRRLQDRITTPSRVERQARQAVTAILDKAEISVVDDDPGTAPIPPDKTIKHLSEGATEVQPTYRWTGFAALPLLAITVAVFTRSPTPLLIAGVGIAIVGSVAWHRDRSLSPDITVERRVDDASPQLDQAVRVTLSITNEGDDYIVDLRCRDGVPPALTVDRGVPDVATPLAPGDTVDISYTIDAESGVHTFNPPYITIRDAIGSTEWLARPTVDGTTSVSCVPPLSEPGPPPRSETTPYAGRVDTHTGGQGVEFYATREYRHGDPLARVNWKRLARTGDLTTIEFRQERAAAVVIVVDTRATARVRPTHTDPHAVTRSVHAASALVGGFLDAGDQVGLATIGPTTHWTPPSAGSAHRAHLRRILAADEAFSPRDNEDGFQAAENVATLRTRITDGTNIILCTPLVDDWAADVAHRLAARTTVSIVSPDPTGGATAGTRLAAVDRSHRISSLRSNGIPVLDWEIDAAFAAALARHERR